jgi:hypothetical protein
MHTKNIYLNDNDATVKGQSFKLKTILKIPIMSLFNDSISFFTLENSSLNMAKAF